MSEALMRAAGRRLAVAGVASPRLDARVLWQAAGQDPGRFEEFVRRREAREPVAYITGHKEFWSLDFSVGPGVLVPRPESETVIEQMLAFFPDPEAPLNILDIGAGTGCLLIAALSEFPHARALGVESSELALEYLLNNVASHDLGDRCVIRQEDWTGNLEGSYDVVVANPPYVRTSELPGLDPEVSRYEPVVALDGGADGLSAYRELACIVERVLAKDGFSFMELGSGQDQPVAVLMAEAGLEIVKIAPDIAGVPRVLVTGHPGGAAAQEKSIGKPPANV